MKFYFSNQLLTHIARYEALLTKYNKKESAEYISSTKEEFDKLGGNQLSKVNRSKCMTKTVDMTFLQAYRSTIGFLLENIKCQLKSLLTPENDSKVPTHGEQKEQYKPYGLLLNACHLRQSRADVRHDKV